MHKTVTEVEVVDITTKFVMEKGMPYKEAKESRWHKYFEVERDAWNWLAGLAFAKAAQLRKEVERDAWNWLAELAFAKAAQLRKELKAVEEDYEKLSAIAKTK